MIHCDGDRVIVEGSGSDILRDFSLISKTLMDEADEADTLYIKDLLHRIVNGEFRD